MLMTAREVAETIGVSTARVYDMIRQGIIPGVRMGRQVRVSRHTLDEWIQGGGQALPGGWTRSA